MPRIHQSPFLRQKHGTVEKYLRSLEVLTGSSELCGWLTVNDGIDQMTITGGLGVPETFEVGDNVRRCGLLPESVAESADAPRPLVNVVFAAVEEDDAVGGLPGEIRIVTIVVAEQQFQIIGQLFDRVEVVDGDERMRRCVPFVDRSFQHHLRFLVIRQVSR